MKLYFHPASTTSRVVTLYAAQEGATLEYQLVDLMTGEHLRPAYAALNPSCLVPMLEDGDFRLGECSAIIKYLADLQGSPAYPRELKQRARVNELMDWFNANLYRELAYGLVYPQLFPHHKRPGDEVQAATLAWGKQKSQRWLAVLDQHLLGPDRRYLCGEQLTLADYLGIEMVLVGELIACDYSAYPNLQRWMNNMKALPSWGPVHEVFNGFAGSLRGQDFVRL